MEKNQKNGVTLTDESLETVSGGGFGDDIPRVPENPIDDDVKNNI